MIFKNILFYILFYLPNNNVIDIIYSDSDQTDLNSSHVARNQSRLIDAMRNDL